MHEALVYLTPKWKERVFLFKTDVFYREKVVTVEVFYHKRMGTKVPEYTWLKYKDRWISPFEQSKFVKIDFNFLFKRHYTPYINKFAIVESKFMQFVLKEQK